MNNIEQAIYKYNILKKQNHYFIIFSNLNSNKLFYKKTLIVLFDSTNCLVINYNHKQKKINFLAKFQINNLNVLDN